MAGLWRIAVLYLEATFGRDARAAESARLESVCGATHRGFESHPLRSHTAGSGRSTSKTDIDRPQLGCQSTGGNVTVKVEPGPGSLRRPSTSAPIERTSVRTM